MTPHELRKHKLYKKQLKEVPVFKPHSKRKKQLPKPLSRIGGSKVFSSGLLEVSDTHSVFMLWREGDILTDRSFYAYLFCQLSDKTLSPLLEFHWHPSHKGQHCKTPCKTTQNFTGRLLPGAPELALATDHKLDPRKEKDRLKLIIKFCETCGIGLPDEHDGTLRLCP
jgi:hypothetical protein